MDRGPKDKFAGCDAMPIDWCCSCDLEYRVTGVSQFEISFLVALARRPCCDCRRSRLGFVYCEKTTLAKDDCALGQELLVFIRPDGNDSAKHTRLDGCLNYSRRHRRIDSLAF